MEECKSSEIRRTLNASAEDRLTAHVPDDAYGLYVTI